MNRQTDQQLLREYSERRSEPAFAELVRRYVDLVYSAARRMVCDSHLAEDVTQSVFVVLAKNATELTGCAVLSGWLHHTAQNLAANVVRSEVRRRNREQESVAMNELLSAESETSWQAIAPYLDAALGEMEDADRDALLLRYFERKSASEMADILGISDEAAQKRVSRAVERLRELFSKRNVTIGASGLTVLITVNAVQAAPIGLASTISAAVLAGTAVTASTITLTKTIAMTTLQKTLVAAVFTASAVLGGAAVQQARQAADLREQNQTLQREIAPLANQIQQLQNERDRATNQLATLLARKADAGPGSNELELLKLRGEVAQFRSSSQVSSWSKSAGGQKNTDPLATAAQSLLQKEQLLKQRLAQMPDKNIPELQYLDPSIWARIAQSANLDTDEGVREAFSGIAGHRQANLRAANWQRAPGICEGQQRPTAHGRFATAALHGFDRSRHFGAVPDA